MIGGISSQLKTKLKIFEGNLNSQKLIDILEDILPDCCYPKKNSKQMSILLDNSKVHQSKKFKEQAEQNQLKLLFLFKYSPDLNYIEMCWGQIKHNIQSKECKSLDEKKKLSKSTQKEFNTQNQIPYMKNKINAILKSKGDYVIN